MSDIYELHEKAFSRVSAFIITDAGGERVATIAFKYPSDGAGRLWCYLHIIGQQMVRGYAGGYGYDKRSAAAYSAASKLAECPIKEALTKDGGYGWDRYLMDAGFNVYQAV